MTFPVRSLAWLLIILAAAIGAARICSAQRHYEPSMHSEFDPPRDRKSGWPKSRPKPMPTFSSNDRARWATVRSLVERGTYVVGTREIAADHTYKDTGIIFEDGWQSIDRVLHPQKREFFSSKPPLLPTLVAGIYWLLHTLFGWTLADHPFAVVRTILVLINLAPFIVYLAVLDHWLGRYTANPWTRLTILAAAAFATVMTPFLITFNNHTVGTCCVLFALDGLLRIWHSESSPPWLAFVQAGFFAAFAVANEMPALAFAAALFGLLLLRAPGRTLAFALPPALVVAFAFFWTNYLAVGQWRPAYSEFGSEWYEYEGSHWRRPPEGEIKYGIDWARFHESRADYAWHVLVGHHGLFSLTPLWLFTVAGMFWLRRDEGRAGKPESALVQESLPAFVPRLTAALTVIVIGFYLYKSDNYGGFSNGLRWLMWLCPLWLLTMIPVVEHLSASRTGRAVVYSLLAISVFSAHYSLWNPWRHPWIYDLMVALGWHGYGR